MPTFASLYNSARFFHVVLQVFQPGEFNFSTPFLIDRIQISSYTNYVLFQT